MTEGSPDSNPGNKGSEMHQIVANPPYPGSKRARRKFTDMRHVEAKKLEAICREVENDLGETNAGQKILLGSLKIRLAVVRGIWQWVEQQPSIVKDGHLLDVLSRSLPGYDNGVRSTILALYGLSKRPPKMIDLDEYLSRCKSADNGNGAE